MIERTVGAVRRMQMPAKTIIVAGGDRDPNLQCLLKRLADRGVDHLALLSGSSPPKLTWTLGNDQLSIGGVEVAPQAIFLRYDVFTFLTTGRAESRRQASRWYHAVLSWALAHDRTVLLNRQYGTRQVSKPHVLALARRIGLDVPETIVSSDTSIVSSGTGSNWIEDFNPRDEWVSDGWIVKPVDGGEYTRVLAEAVMDETWVERCGASPNIIQRRLCSPDLRIYRIGDAWFAFALNSGEIDYRTDRAVSIVAVPAPRGLVDRLHLLMDELGLNFGAADFKTCPITEDSLFLEVNPAPMFSTFDRVADGALSNAIVDRLVSGSGAEGIPDRETESTAAIKLTTTTSSADVRALMAAWDSGLARRRE
jgi:hypothetical protein